MTYHLTPENDWRPGFLEGLAEYGNVSAAARDAGISRQHAYQTRAADPEFAAAWDEALAIGIEGLEDEAKRRAFQGVSREVSHYFQGTCVGTDVIVDYSDTLLIFLLKAHKPTVYRETTRHELTGKDGETLPAPIVYIPQVDGE